MILIGQLIKALTKGHLHDRYGHKKENKPQKQSQQNSLENLFAEPDKAMLMGLIMLLKSEGADETLIMALMYILS